MPERVNIFKKSTKSKHDAVRFWMDDYSYSNYYNGSNQESSLSKLFSLYTIKNTISNFIQITSEKNVKVKYFGSESNVDPENNVTISADLDDFDSVVGLALHESSHISLSANSIYKELYELIAASEHEKRFKSYHTNPKIEKIVSRYYDIIKSGIKDDRTLFSAILFLFKYFKNLLNLLEDRRIDYTQVQKFPGYVAYYEKLYSHYFYNDKISKALKSELYRTKTFDSYDFRICYFINENADALALPKLDVIYDMIKIQNLVNCINQYEIADIALDVFEIIFNECKDSLTSSGIPKTDKNVREENKEKENKENEKEPEKKETQKENKSAEKDEELPDASDDTDESEGENDENDENEPDESDEQVTLTDAEIKEIAKIYQETEDLINQNDDVNKTIINKDVSGKIDLLDSGAISILSTSEIKNINVISINKLSNVIEKQFPLLFQNDTWLKSYVNSGISKGQMLGRKLQILNDEKLTKSVRKVTGSIDNRLLSEIGFKNPRIFTNTKVEEYNRLYVYLTLDSSGSMAGTEWNNTLHMAAAIASALTYVEGVRVVISTRATARIDWNENPFVMTIYDSKVNNMNHIRKWWYKLRASGNTPEGLVFDALMSKILKDAEGRDAYFINVSDGAPSCSAQDWNNPQGGSGYGSRTATEHTRHQVEKLIRNGISVLSYLISGASYHEAFNQMYGKHAFYINVCDMMKLAYTLNKKFVERTKISR